MQDSRGPGYRYFGAAKQLPGVKELFEKEAPKQVRKWREDGGKVIWQQVLAVDVHFCLLRASGNTSALFGSTLSCRVLLAACCVTQVFRTRQQLFKSITPDYYGFRDEEDGVLLEVEKAAEAAMQAQVGLLCFFWWGHADVEGGLGAR